MSHAIKLERARELRTLAKNLHNAELPVSDTEDAVSVSHTVAKGCKGVPAEELTIEEAQFVLTELAIAEQFPPNNKRRLVICHTDGKHIADFDMDNTHATHTFAQIHHYAQSGPVVVSLQDNRRPAPIEIDLD